MTNIRRGNSETEEIFNYEEIAVDTDPGAPGFGCNGVRGADKSGIDRLVFYISEITSATVHLQWSRDNINWTDYDSYTAVIIKEIYNKTKYWRSVVKNTNQGTSSVSGIEWNSNS